MYYAGYSQAELSTSTNFWEKPINYLKRQVFIMTKKV